MKLGLLADIHEHVSHLEAALKTFRAERVGQIVILGDVFETGKRIRETCRLLEDAKAVGVWGNHDYGLCTAADDEMLLRYGAGVIDFMGTLLPNMNLAGCHFHHVEPWLDANSIADLWYFDGPPDTPEKIGRVFDAAPERLIFAGHLHCWLAITPAGRQDWQGETPLSLAAGRFFVVIGALCEGRYAIFDTETSRLFPHHNV